MEKGSSKNLREIKEQIEARKVKKMANPNGEETRLRQTMERKED